MNDIQQPKRRYRHITPATVAKHKALALANGNGSAAVRESDPDILAPHDRAWRIQNKSEAVSTVEFIENTLQQIGVVAINRLGELVNSNDEAIATRNTHYAIDHIRGQAVRREERKQVNLNIEAALFGE